MSWLRRALARPSVYRLWQAPFAERKLAPVLVRDDLRAVRRVLDVGCGPGTNSRHFLATDYLGVDYNERYIADATRRYGRQFVVADVNNFRVPPGESFDFILVNSLLHHLSDPEVRRLLRHLRGLLSKSGHVHILELVLPSRPGIARLLARYDRGEFPRPLEEWRALLSESFEPVIVEPYSLTCCGAVLWNMVYFKGRVNST